MPSLVRPLKLKNSDNGTNFVGACAELKRGLSRLDKAQITTSMASRGVDWRFNPPLASHQGGAWKSMIRLVRKTLMSLMEDSKIRTFSEKGLETLFREVQLILNSRPITTVSSDPSDLRALSPLSILTGCIDPALPPDIFVRSDGMRSSWRASQYCAEEFWKRWSLEYFFVYYQGICHLHQRWHGPLKDPLTSSEPVFLVVR